MDAIRIVEAAQLKKDRQGFEPGDQVRVHVKVVEGEKERTQVFDGTVIRKRGEGARASFTVRRISYGVGVGIVDHLTIDRINILAATRLAMGHALAVLGVTPDLVITDFVALPALPCPQRNLVDGDARCASVAAASIVAKVTRDRMMLEADKQFPDYGFARHKGYGTADHLAALDRLGACPIHRRSFSGVWRQGELFVLEDED